MIKIGDFAKLFAGKAQDGDDVQDGCGCGGHHHGAASEAGCGCSGHSHEAVPEAGSEEGGCCGGHGGHGHGGHGHGGCGCH